MLGQFFLGRLVGHGLQWLGGAVRYLYGTVIRDLKLTKRQRYTFKEYVNGPDQPNDVVFDTIGHRFNNRLLGLVIAGVLLAILIRSCDPYS